MTTTEQDRAAFEADYGRRNGYPALAIAEGVLARSRNDHGGYSGTMQHEWQGFQAALAYAREQRAERVFPVQARSRAANNVLAERRRQIEMEGWTPEHDDEHKNGEMACAAACYALYSARCAVKNYADGEPEYSVDRDTLWPWGFDWWKPKDRRRDLVRAAALIIAEIERLDRAAFNAQEPKP